MSTNATTRAMTMIIAGSKRPTMRVMALSDFEGMRRPTCQAHPRARPIPRPPKSWTRAWEKIGPSRRERQRYLADILPHLQKRLRNRRCYTSTHFQRAQHRQPALYKGGERSGEARAYDDDVKPSYYRGGRF